MLNNSPSTIYPKTIDLTNCDGEPIHLVGRIQNHGVMIVADAETKRINRSSENCVVLFSKSADALLNTPLQEIIPEKNFKGLFDNFDIHSISSIPCEINSHSVDAIMHEVNGERIIEFEFKNEIDDSMKRQLMLTKVVSSMRSSFSQNVLTEKLVNTIKEEFG